MNLQKLIDKNNLALAALLSFVASFSPVYPDDAQDAVFKKIALSIQEKAKKSNKTKIAVLAYQSLDEKNTRSGETISEEVIVHLVNNSVVSVIERNQVEKLLNELQFNQTGIMDAATAKKIGYGLGADALVIGSYTEINEKEIKIFTKLVDTETFQILGADQQVMKKPGETNLSENLSVSRPGQWSTSELSIMSGVSIPGNSISTLYLIEASNILTKIKITNNLQDINLAMAVPVVLRTSFWTGPVGFGVDLGYTSFKFMEQEIPYSSKKTSSFTIASLGSTTEEIKQTVNFSTKDYYQLNIVHISLNFLLRIPIHPMFIPYAGIGYKFSLQSLSHTGTGDDIYSPFSDSEAGLELGVSAYNGSIQGLLNLFTYIGGFQFYLFDHIGIGVEYQLITYGDTRYYKLSLGKNTYQDPNFGTVKGDISQTLDLTLTPLQTHNIRIAVLFKFN